MTFFGDCKGCVYYDKGYCEATGQMVDEYLYGECEFGIEGKEIQQEELKEQEGLKEWQRGGLAHPHEFIKKQGKGQ